MSNDKLKEYMESLKDDLAEATGITKEELFAEKDFVSECVCAAKEMERAYIEYYQEMYGIDIMKLCEELIRDD